jgi:signal transduction histidine kinase
MNSGSLRLRLILAASFAISLSLAIAGFAFYRQFQTQVSNLVLEEFDAHFQQLAANLSFDDEGRLQIDGELSDPRFAKQFGGLYWQIDLPDKPPLRSRSLWDETLSVPTPPAEDGDVHTHDVAGPNGSTLLSTERLLQIEKPDGSSLKTIVTIGMDKSKVSNAITQFSNEMTIGLGLLYLVLMGSAIAQIVIGLRPMEAVRQSLQKIRNNSATRMEGKFPAEVQPLAAEMNTLLEAREQQLNRARKRAGNLAHGLKTPLTVLDAIATDIADRGQAEAADEIREVSNDMRALVDRELMRARSSADSPYASSLVHPVVSRVMKAMQQIRGPNSLNWEQAVDTAATLPIEAGDLMELVGNLLDNAQKHAVATVRIGVQQQRLLVEDDGPGVDTASIPAILKRGVKLDEHKSGSGLGLAIVRDIAEAYGAILTLDRSSLGGLAVGIEFASPANTVR